MCSTLQIIRSSPAALRWYRRDLPHAVRSRLLVSLTLLALLRAGAALAGEQPPPAGGDWKPDPHAAPGAGSHPLSLFELPEAYRPLDLSGVSLAPQQNFRPRGRSMLARDEAFPGTPEAPLIGSTTVWQRLSEYRTRDRVRVLTLWETGRNTVSLQADHRGDPSLQWTSHLTGRGAATHGILDELFAKSVSAVVGRGPRETSRPAAAEFGGRSERLPEAGKMP